MMSILAALLLAGTVPSASAPSGELRATGVQDLLLVKRKPRWYNEMWSWQFLFDNGTQASLNFTWARMGFKDPVCGADLSLAGFRGRNYTVGREYPEDRFQQQASPFRIQIHPEIWAQGLPPGSHRVHFATTKNEGYFVDLEFSRMEPGVVWGDGTWKAGEGNLTMALAIPSARVKGRIAVGRDTVAVEGWAVLEHVRQTALLADILTRSFRGFEAGERPAYVNAFREKGGGWTGYAVEWSASGPRLIPAAQVLVGEAGDQPPSSVSVVGADRRSFAFRRTTVAQSASILDGMEGVTRWVVKQFVGNVILQRGRLDRTNSFYQFTSVK
jgi:hypothetical protein